MRNRDARHPEWGTFALIIACYACWAACLFWLFAAAPVATTILAGVVIAFHASLTHEVLHGHPFAARPVNDALMFLPLGLFIPFNRFRDTHLAHHRDANLTDPYDDPETNYLDPAVWAALPRWKQAIWRANNTLLGRVTLGPALGQILFLRTDARAALGGDAAVLRAWGLHAIGATGVICLIWAAPMPLWAYLISAYIGLALPKIRTFLEHQAHEKIRARTVIIEDRGPLAFLFLNNNLHVVHHMNPDAPWYRLPALYRAGKARYQGSNDGYVFASYGDVFRQYLWRAKDPVPHPLWPRD